MILFHPFLWPFVLIGLSLVVTTLTAFDLPRRLWTPRGAGLPGERGSRASTVAKARPPVAVRIVRNGGIFWFCAGVVTVVHALTSESSMRPGAAIGMVAGLVWVVLGVSLFRSTLPRPAVRLRLDGKGARLPQIVAQIAERECVAGQVGLVVGAVAGREEFLHGCGALRIGGTEPPGAETLFEIGSITKVFTGILLARAIEAGELHLDDRIADLLPEGWTLSEAARGITLRHCATHTSGLPRLPANLLTFAESLRVAFRGGDPYRDYTEEQFREALATVTLLREPGTKAEYSNFGVGLLGFVLARRSGSNYESLVRDQLCRPLGMPDTVITTDEPAAERLPSRYRLVFRLGPWKSGLESDEWRIPNPLAGAGAIRSTGRDMLTFLKANLGLVSTPLDAAIRRSHQELFRDPAGLTTGMNWIRSFDDELAREIVWHNGGTGGFRAYLGFTEDRRFGVVVLGNTAHSVDAIGIEILRSLARESAADGAG